MFNYHPPLAPFQLLMQHFLLFRITSFYTPFFSKTDSENLTNPGSKPTIPKFADFFTTELHCAQNLEGLLTNDQKDQGLPPKIKNQISTAICNSC